MIRAFRLLGTLAAAGLVWAGAALPAAAADGRVPVPHLAAPAKGETCVAPIDVIRRNHPDLLKAQRDETMRLGIRGGKYSLTGCIDCHAVPDPKAPDSKVRTIEPFCDQCHAYAAVTLDCWSCHNPTTTEPAKTARVEEPLDTGTGNLVAALKAHLAKGSASR